MDAVNERVMDDHHHHLTRALRSSPVHPNNISHPQVESLITDDATHYTKWFQPTILSLKCFKKPLCSCLSAYVAMRTCLFQ